MVVVSRRRQIEQFLQQPMNRRRPKHIVAADHIADPLQRVVDNHGKMVTRWCVLAGQNHIAPNGRIGGHDAGFAIRSDTGLQPGQWSCHLADGGRHVETPVLLPVLSTTDGVGHLHLETRKRKERRPVRIARPRFSGFGFASLYGLRNLLAANSRRIKDVFIIQTIERAFVVRKMIRLPPNRFLPFQAQPGEVFVDQSLEFRPTAGNVRILDAQ